MSEISRIYDEIRKTEMNDWVGGSDPEVVGGACYGILSRYLTMDAGSRLLDFGCGVGRVLLAILRNRPMVGHVSGFDIMPQVVNFCDRHIAASFGNTSFELIRGSNDHYDQFIAAAGSASPRSSEELNRQYGGQFSGAYAFSVFTHVEVADFRSLLRFLAVLLKPGGELLFTCFLLTPYSRRAIEQRTGLFPFGETAFENDGQVFIGNVPDRLGPSSFRVEPNSQNRWSSSSPVGMWAGCL